MKRKLSFLGIVLTVILAFAGFTACNSGMHYENADKYTAGGATLTQNVKNLDIIWTSGDLEIKHGDVDGVVFSETAAVPLNERTSLYYWLDGETLRIRYAQSVQGIHMGNYPSKALVVTLPQECVLQSLDLDVVSTDVQLTEVRVADIEVDNVSGSVNATMSEFTKDLEMEAISGDITLKGSVAESLEVESTSGNIRIELKATPKTCDIDNVSGNVTLTFPENAAGFTLTTETTSGEFYSDLPMTNNGDKRVYGDGSGTLNIETVSGNIRLEVSAE